MNFRRATLSDLPALMVLQERCHEPSLRDSEADAAHDIATNVVLVLCINGLPSSRLIGSAIGCPSKSGNWFHVYSVEIDPTYQRRGLGKRLLTSLLTHASPRAALSADAATLGGSALLRKFPQIEVRNAAPDASLK